MFKLLADCRQLYSKQDYCPKFFFLTMSWMYSFGAVYILLSIAIPFWQVCSDYGAHCTQMHCLRVQYTVYLCEDSILVHWSTAHLPDGLFVSLALICSNLIDSFCLLLRFLLKAAPVLCWGLLPPAMATHTSAACLIHSACVCVCLSSIFSLTFLCRQSI